MKKQYGVLFICTGNTCRSPMAEGILKAKLPEELRNIVSVKSAGILSVPGSSAAENAIIAASDFGSDISNHVSQVATQTLLHDSNVVLCMARNHRDYLSEKFPAYHDNFFLLKDFAATIKAAQPDIPDPIGGDLATYGECSRVIAGEIDRVLPVLKVFAETTYP